MNKYRALKRLRHLKDFKKYLKLDQRCIDVAKKIFTNNLIGEDSSILLQCSSSSIQIAKTIKKVTNKVRRGLPVIYIEIKNSGETYLTQGLTDILNASDISNFRFKGKDDATIIKICQTFNDCCDYAESNKEKLFYEFKKFLEE